MVSCSVARRSAAPNPPGSLNMQIARPILIAIAVAGFRLIRGPGPEPGMRMQPARAIHQQEIMT